MSRLGFATRSDSRQRVSNLRELSLRRITLDSNTWARYLGPKKLPVRNGALGLWCWPEIYEQWRGHVDSFDRRTGRFESLRYFWAFHLCAHFAHLSQEACRLCDPPNRDYSLSVPYKPEPEPKKLEPVPATESTSEDTELQLQVFKGINGGGGGGGGVKPESNGFGVGFGTGLAAGAIIMVVLQRLFKKKQHVIESPSDDTAYRDDAPETELGSLT